MEGAHAGGCQDCTCTITKEELKVAGVRIGEQCLDCFHTLGRHRDPFPTSSAVLSGKSSDIF